MTGTLFHPEAEKWTAASCIIGGSETVAKVRSIVTSDAFTDEIARAVQRVIEDADERCDC